MLVLQELCGAEGWPGDPPASSFCILPGIHLGFKGKNTKPIKPLGDTEAGDTSSPLACGELLAAALITKTEQRRDLLAGSWELIT